MTTAPTASSRTVRTSVWEIADASMDLGAVHDDWEVIDLEDGTYNIKNIKRGNYMEWYAEFSNWSTYNSSSAATDGQFKLQVL